MFKTLKKTVLLLVFALAFVCGAVFFAACEGPETGPVDDGDGKVIYSVTVITEVGSIKLTSLKAQWFVDTSTTPASEEISLDENGKASVELDSGNYTVALVGVPTAAATYTPVFVTAITPGATITIKALVLTPTQLTAPAKVTIDGRVLTWTHTTYASGYIIYQDDEEIGTVDRLTLTYTLPESVDPDGHVYTIVAKGDGVHFADSAKSAPAAPPVAESDGTVDASETETPEEANSGTESTEE